AQRRRRILRYSPVGYLCAHRRGGTGNFVSQSRADAQPRRSGRESLLYRAGDAEWRNGTGLGRGGGQRSGQLRRNLRTQSRRKQQSQTQPRLKPVLEGWWPAVCPPDSVTDLFMQPKGTLARFGSTVRGGSTSMAQYRMYFV